MVTSLNEWNISKREGKQYTNIFLEKPFRTQFLHIIQTIQNNVLSGKYSLEV